MPRKTVDVEHLREIANAMLAMPEREHLNADVRIGIISLLEAMLHSTGQYKGFRYQTSEFDNDHLRRGYDDTRRIYL